MASVLSVGIPLFLFLIWGQMLISLELFAGVFILSNQTLISPFIFSLEDGHPDVLCSPLVIAGLYVPLVLVAFALLASLFAVYGKDDAVLKASAVLQTGSSLLFMIGLSTFLLLHRPYVRWDHMTPWFYICIGVEAQLIVSTVLTWRTWRRLTSHWF